MPPKSQLFRDLACGFIIILYTYLFFTALTHYLSGLQKPFILIFAFSASLIATYIFELRHERNRQGFVGIAATAILFTAGVQLAQYFRVYYIDLLMNIDNIKGAHELIGEEYLSLATSKVVGYGGAYGLGLITTRLIGQNAIKKVLSAILITENFQVEKCHHCKQDISS